MHLNEYREAGLDGRFSRQTVLSVLIFVVVWEVLSYFAPALGIPAVRHPEFRAYRAEPADDHADRHRRHASRGDRRARFCRSCSALLLAMLMYQSETLENYLHPLIRLFMAVPVVSWILFAVLWFRGVEFRIAFVLIAVCGPVFLIDCVRCHARRVA